MKWTILRWVWRLEGPLFIGMPPAGSLNRCRLYVPAQAVHGAVTAELARLKGDEKSKFPDYGKFGREMGMKCRFTYLYPAEKIGEKYSVWLPKYEKGLQWYKSGGQTISAIPDREFRRRLLDSRPGTAISPETDAASEGTLRETECINPWWRDLGGKRTEKPVFLLGYVFLKNNHARKQLEHIQTLFIGGDTRYGLGRLSRICLDPLFEDSLIFGNPMSCLNCEDPWMESDVILGHSPVTPSHPLQGAQELLAGWNPDALKKEKLCWSPGSSLLSSSASWFIDNYGCWNICKNALSAVFQPEKIV